MLEGLGKFLKFGSFLKEEYGGVLIYAGFALPVLLGVSALAVDVATWHAHKRAVQTAADAAAMAGAGELLRLIESSNRETSAQTEAAVDATVNGYDNTGGASEADVLTINIPPTAGDFAGNTSAIEAIIRRPVRTFMAGLVYQDQAFVTSRAVAYVSGGQFCVFSLNTASPNALQISGGATMSLGCGVSVNSTASSPDEALHVTGGGCLNATVIKVAGDFSGGGCYNDAKPYSGTQSTPNPLAGQFSPPPEAADSEPCATSGNIIVLSGDTLSLPSGKHCGKITVQSGGTLTLDGGNHVFEKALTVHGTINEDVSSNGVTLYLPDDTSSADALNISAGAQIDLSATTTGDLANVLIYVDENATGNVTHTVTGQASSNLSGLIYMPSHDLKFSGASSASGVMLIADELQLSGQANFGNLGIIPAFANQEDLVVRMGE